MKTKTLKNQRKKTTPKQVDNAIPIIEHLYELRRRIFYCLLTIAVVAISAYFIQQHLVNLLLAPANGQQFIYTNVTGGIGFLFQLCLYIGVAVSLPVIAYQLLRYLEPMLQFNSWRFIVLASVACGLLSLAGMAFGYFIGLPTALHFLLHQFTTKQIRPLLTIQEYMLFVTVYMLGSALLFQLPLLLLLINRIKPLKPKKLWHYERWVVLGAFVVSGLMNPTPDIFSQLMLAGPIIIMYQIGILLIWRINLHRESSSQIQELLVHDNEIRMNRQQNSNTGDPAPALLPLVCSQPLISDIAKPVAQHSYRQIRQPERTSYEVPRRTFIMDVRPPIRRAME